MVGVQLSEAPVPMARLSKLQTGETGGREVLFRAWLVSAIALSEHPCGACHLHLCRESRP